MNLTDFMDLCTDNKALDDKTFGRFMRQRREELGKTVRGLAAELDLTAAYISDIENGHRYAPKKYMGKLRKALKVIDEDSLLFEDLASASRGNQYEDINAYLGKSPLARKAVRKARDLGIPDSQWKAFIDSMVAPGSEDKGQNL